MKTWEKYKKSELLKLPKRDWLSVSNYDSVLLVNTRIKHNSGYNLFAIIGCNDGTPIEIAGYMDDFRLCKVRGTALDDIILTQYSIGIDCSMHGVFRIHSNKYTIRVGSNTSTTCFEFVPYEKYGHNLP